MIREIPWGAHKNVMVIDVVCRYKTEELKKDKVMDVFLLLLCYENECPLCLDSFDDGDRKNLLFLKIVVL